jgi:hypothetical protein
MVQIIKLDRHPPPPPVTARLDPHARAQVLADLLLKIAPYGRSGVTAIR